MTREFVWTTAFLAGWNRCGFNTQEDCVLYVAVNAHWEDHRFTFPIVPEGFGWHLAFSSDGFSCDPGTETPWEEDGITLGARTTAVLIAKITE